MADRMKVEGGKVTVESGAPVTSVDFVASNIVLEVGVTLRNCTVDIDSVVSTLQVPAVSPDDGVSPPVVPVPTPAPPVPPLPQLDHHADVEL